MTTDDGAVPVHLRAPYRSTPVAPARLAAWAGSLVRTRSRGEATIGESPLSRHRAFVGLAGIAFVALMVLTRDGTFSLDEWYWIGRPGYGPGLRFGDPAGWFLPANEHFAVVHAAVFTGLLAVFGLSTYAPFVATLLATHIAFVAAIYLLLDRHVGRRPALAAAAIGLFLGSGYFNLFSAFQMGFVGALALATWGLLVIRDRPGLAAILLSLGVATQGTALFVIPAAGLYGRSKRGLLAVGLAVAVYATWYLAAGDAVPHRGDPPTAMGWLAYMAGGVEATAAATTGLGGFGLVVLLAALIAVARHVPLPAVVGGVALLTEYALLGLSRQGFSDPGASRYVYPACMFALLILASAWPRLPRFALPAAAVVALSALASNVLQLMHWGLGGWVGYLASHPPR